MYIFIYIYIYFCIYVYIYIYIYIYNLSTIVYKVSVVRQDLVSLCNYSFKEEFYSNNYGKYIDHGLQQFVGIKKFFS